MFALPFSLNASWVVHSIAQKFLKQNPFSLEFHTTELLVGTQRQLHQGQTYSAAFSMLPTQNKQESAQKNPIILLRNLASNKLNL